MGNRESKIGPIAYPLPPPYGLRPIPYSLPLMWHPYPRPMAGIALLTRRMLSPELRNFRNVVVALPPSYADDSTRRYPVVYMQDGQNLFDPHTSYAGDWRLGETLVESAQRDNEAIVVGVANARQHRLYEYSPFPDRRLGGGGGDRYLAFLVETLKPSIDREFRTFPDRDDTAIAGSSMGALISLYAAHRCGEVFGSVAALSPSLWFAGRRLLRFIESSRLTRLPRIYLDIGLAEPAAAVADVRRLKAILLRLGHRLEASLDYVEDEDGRHDEATWGRRFGRALAFLLQAP